MTILTPAIIALLAISSIPIGVLCFDLFRRKGFKPMAIVLLAFLLFCIVALFLLDLFGLYVVLLFPIALFIALFSRRKKPNQKRTIDQL